MHNMYNTKHKYTFQNTKQFWKIIAQLASVDQFYVSCSMRRLIVYQKGYFGYVPFVKNLKMDSKEEHIECSWQNDEADGTGGKMFENHRLKTKIDKRDVAR